MISIRRQLTRDLLLALAGLFGAGLLALGTAVWWELTASFDMALRARAMTLASLTEVEGGKLAFDFSADLLRQYAAERPRNYFELWAADGARLTRSLSLRDADLDGREEGTAAKPKFWNLTLPNRHPARAVAFAFAPTPMDQTPAPEAVRSVRLVVAVDREDFDETLHGLLAGVAGGGVLLLAAVFFVVPRVLRRGLAPLARVGDEAARIDADSLAMRFSTGELPLELQPIAGRLNDLLARLEQSFERERRFSADLAHELRTPLAELRSAAECALKWPESRDPATDRETLAIARQMEKMVAHMLALTRGEQGQLTLRLEPLALEKLVPEVWRGFAARAAERRLDVTFSLAEATAVGDAALLRSILANLCDNAVDYAPAGGAVSFRLERGEGRVRLHVANATDDLAAEDVPRLFDRFWRKEAARTGGQHVGLGLSLARSLALTMGWTLTAALDPERRLVFTLSGPATATADSPVA